MTTLNAKDLGWGSVESQVKRFKILSEIGDLTGKSVLDVGCGFGDLYDYLKYKISYYVGIDINPKQIEEAKKRYPVEFHIGKIDKVMGHFDYVFASGIFNLEKWKGTNETIQRMFELSDIGIGFNMLSDKADFFNKGETYTNPGEMLEFCLKLSRKVVLRHDYMTHDFTVYIYKEKT